jgi:hypothetical protein
MNFNTKEIKLHRASNKAAHLAIIKIATRVADPGMDAPFTHSEILRAGKRLKAR